MKYNILVYTIISAITLATCSNGAVEQGPVHVPVSGITGIPTRATAGTALTLTGTVVPMDATNKTIAWSVKSKGETGATISGGNRLNAAAGTVTVTATIASGKTETTDWTQDFTVIVNKAPEVPDYNLWKIENGKFYYDGEWRFLKIAKCLLNFADRADVDRLISQLDILKAKNYTNIEINCYWHHFDTDGDGVPDKSPAPLRNLIDAIYLRGMYPCLSVETYAVGGGTIPEGFWETHPDAYAINDKGQKVTDTEYGFGTKVVSIFHRGYRDAVHAFIKNLARGIDTRKVLWFETTVEPQYMGGVKLCYSPAAREEYGKWREANNITDPDSEMPATFPIPQTFVKNPTWNRFRAQFLAKWVNGDAAAWREIAGERAYVAADYLDAGEAEQYLRVGEPLEFLRGLSGVDIIQVNWSWYFPENKPNQKAYDRVRQIMGETGRDWAVSEHMTFNGSDFVRYGTGELNAILTNTLRQGTRLGWEFVDVAAASGASFALYNDDWTPKKEIEQVDKHWDEWVKKAKDVEAGNF